MALLRDWQTGAVLMVTFGLTLVPDLTYGIVAECLLAALFAVVPRARPQPPGS